eukprot:gene4140-2982_t
MLLWESIHLKKKKKSVYALAGMVRPNSVANRSMSMSLERERAEYTVFHYGWVGPSPLIIYSAVNFISSFLSLHPPYLSVFLFFAPIPYTLFRYFGSKESTALKSISPLCHSLVPLVLMNSQRHGKKSRPHE